MTSLVERLKGVLEFDVEGAHREICDLAASGGRERWRMSIPVRADDSDMILQAPLDHIERTRALMMAMVECCEALARFSAECPGDDTDHGHIPLDRLAQEVLKMEGEK